MRQIIVKNSNLMKPINRFGLIHKSLETIANESRDLLKWFGLQLIEKQIQIKAREASTQKSSFHLQQYHYWLPRSRVNYKWFCISNCFVQNIKDNDEDNYEVKYL